jgi:hypothetical protein
MTSIRLSWAKIPIAFTLIFAFAMNGSSLPAARNERTNLERGPIKWKSFFGKTELETDE